MIDKKIVIINQALPPKSIYTYSKLLYDINNSNSEMINLINPALLKNAVVHSGIDIKPIMKWYYLYYVFPKIYYRNASNLIKKSFHDSIIHYSLQGLPRIDNNKKYLYTVHDNPNKMYNTNLYNYKSTRIEKIKNKMLKMVFNKYVMKSKYIITNTDYVRKSVIQWGYKGNIDYVYLPPSPNFYKLDTSKKILREQLGLPEDKKLLLSISNNEIRKNINTLEDLTDLLGDEYKLVRIGTPIKNSINFQNVPETSLNLIYNAVDALIFPSLEEGQGIPILESFNTGLPVVASDIEPFREIGGDSVIYIDPLSVKSLYTGIKDALGSSEELVNRGFRQGKKFSFDSFKTKMNSIYRKINDDENFY